MTDLQRASERATIERLYQIAAKAEGARNRLLCDVSSGTVHPMPRWRQQMLVDLAVSSRERANHFLSQSQSNLAEGLIDELATEVDAAYADKPSLRAV